MTCVRWALFALLLAGAASACGGSSSSPTATRTAAPATPTRVPVTPLAAATAYFQQLSALLDDAKTGFRSTDPSSTAESGVEAGIRVLATLGDQLAQMQPIPEAASAHAALVQATRDLQAVAERHRVTTGLLEDQTAEAEAVPIVSSFYDACDSLSKVAESSGVDVTLACTQ
jgi:hypothetical protein